MRLSPLLLAASIAAASAPAHAIFINEQAFVANGGNLHNISGTVPRVFDGLRNASLATQFFHVGKIEGCTATLIGTDARYAWVLTAAHCMPNSASPSMPVSTTFRDSRGLPIAGGAGGWSFVHPYRIKPPAGHGGASTDIAVLRLPIYPWGHTTVHTPELYDGSMELNKLVAFAGYGWTGVGLASTDAFWPKQGERRMWGEAVVDSIYEEDHGIGASYVPTGQTASWARVAPGDSGSAWWQRHDGRWSIIATTNGGFPTASTAARVSKYADWIESLYPAVNRHSKRMRVTESVPFRSHDYASEAPHGTAYYVVSPGQKDVHGPTQGTWSGARTHSVVTVPVRHAASGATTLVKLRATREIPGCAIVRMEDAVGCASSRSGVMTMQFHAADNPGLPSGEWRGRVDIDAVGWHASYRQRFPVDVLLMHGVRATVTRTKAYQSFNFAWFARHGTVSYLVPPQSGASGPTGATWSGANTHSTITVQARDAITQNVVPIRLRAQRFSGCAWKAMNDAVGCDGSLRQGPLHVSFDARDNGGLSRGIYRGVVHIQANGWHDASMRNAIALNVEIDTFN